MAKSFFADMLDEKPQGVLAQAIAQPKRNGTMHTIGIIADALATLGGAQPGYRMGLEHREDRNAAQQRQSLLDQLTQAQIATARNPKPERPAVQQNYEYLKTLNPPAADAYIQNFGAPPMQALDVTGADGSVTRQYMPRTGPVAPQSTLPPGYTVRPKSGGASRPGSRTFPIR